MFHWIQERPPKKRNNENVENFRSILFETKFFHSFPFVEFWKFTSKRRLSIRICVRLSIDGNDGNLEGRRIKSGEFLVLLSSG